MSVSGVSLSSLFGLIAQNVQNRIQQFQQNFQQLGQDLQSGNLTAAQSDLTALQQLGLQSNSSTSQSQNANPAAQDFTQLAQDLQSGNLSASQQDFTKLQQDLQSSSTQTPHHHHHHGASGGNSINQILGQLGQALQSGNLSNAQQAYNTLLQDFEPAGQDSAQTQTSPSSGSTVSVSA